MSEPSGVSPVAAKKTISDWASTLQLIQRVALVYDQRLSANLTKLAHPGHALYQSKAVQDLSHTGTKLGSFCTEPPADRTTLVQADTSEHAFGAISDQK